MFKQFDRVCVLWIDSNISMETWEMIDGYDYDTFDKGMYYESIGYFLNKTSTSTYIAQSKRQHMDCGGRSVGRIIAIPNVAIIKIGRL